MPAVGGGRYSAPDLRAGVRPVTDTRTIRLGFLLSGLALAWLLWSGVYSTRPFIFSLGVGSCLFVLWLSMRMGRTAAVEVSSLPGRGFSLRMLVYLPWLAWQVVLANLNVARRILSPSLPIAPRLLRVPAHQRTPLCQVIHANSITLTPGTITLDLRSGQLLVHALDEESARGIEEEVIDRQVSQLEGGT